MIVKTIFEFDEAWNLRTEIHGLFEFWVAYSSTTLSVVTEQMKCVAILIGLACSKLHLTFT